MSDKTNVGILSPWDTYKHIIFEFFSKDPDINVQDGDMSHEGSVYTFWIESQNSERLAALESIMKNDIEMGNITLHIDFKYANGPVDTYFDPNNGETWKTAFLGNYNFEKLITQQFSPASVASYAIFGRDIISYYNDNLQDYCGNSHIIPADAVKQFTVETGVIVCTLAPAQPGTGGQN